MRKAPLPYEPMAARTTRTRSADYANRPDARWLTLRADPGESAKAVWAGPGQALNVISILRLHQTGGAGWYFFYVAQFGHHVRMIAVEVSEDGTRKYLLIEHLILTSGPKPAERNITGRVNKVFDEFNRVDKRARLGSNVWQVYFRRQE